MTLTEHRPTIETMDHDWQRGQLRTIPLRLSSNGASSDRQYWTGREWQLGTAAFWESAAEMAVPPPTYRLGNNLVEELGVCLLGGYGIPFALGNAAFEALREEGVFLPNADWSVDEVERLLRAPLMVEGHTRKYRFPRQKAVRLVNGIAFVRTGEEPRSDVELRNWLTEIAGVGPKTASWVVRNHRSSDEVAIVDIHIVRAGTVAGVFDPLWVLPRDYALFERAFLSWASQADLSAALLDACIWGTLARSGVDSRDILGVSDYASDLRPVWDVTHSQLRGLSRERSV